jgi:hypothetical protein
MFNMYSRLSYRSAHRVTSLFRQASKIQQDLGCSPEKCEVIRNGIVINEAITIPATKPDGWVDIGAIVRVAPIKDLKTLIYTFFNLKHEMETRLQYQSGEDVEHNQECLVLIDLGIHPFQVTHQWKNRFYRPDQHSEGQPLRSSSRWQRTGPWWQLRVLRADRRPKTTISAQLVSCRPHRASASGAGRDVLNGEMRYTMERLRNRTF